MTKGHAVNIVLKQSGFDNFSGRQCCRFFPGGCALGAIASAPASINHFFEHNHTWGVINISASHVQCGIQALAIFKCLECIKLHLRELQKISRRSMRRKLPRKVCHCYISRLPVSQVPPSAPGQEAFFVVSLTQDPCLFQNAARETNCLIEWIEIYPVDRVIHHLNNWAQDFFQALHITCWFQFYFVGP